MIPVMIVPVLNDYDKLQKMFNTIDYPIEHAIIIDNGGSLKSINSDFVKEISVINLPYNLGISIPHNIGIKLTPMSKYWLFAQNDITWVAGGLEKIDKVSGSDYMCLGLEDDRPFACRTIGENVIAKIGLFDESFFPAPGDDFNFHKRCHRHNIEERDISGTYIAEKSSTIKEMLLNRTISLRTWTDNFQRSLFGPAVDNGWSLKTRRSQSDIGNDSIDEINKIVITLDKEYKIHNEYENIAFLHN